MKSLTIYTLEGLVGAGKSYALNYISQNLPKKTSVYFLSEPLEILENYKGHKPLKLLSDQNENCEGLIQLLFIKSLYNYYRLIFERIPENSVIITDRYLDSCLLFTEVLFQTKKINSFEKELLTDICSSYLEKLPKITKVIYLQRSPEYCLKNIASRGRNYEKWLLKSNNQYIYQLYEIYENNLAKCCSDKVFINTSTDLSTIMNEIINLSDELKVSTENSQSQAPQHESE